MRLGIGGMDSEGLGSWDSDGLDPAIGAGLEPSPLGRLPPSTLAPTATTKIAATSVPPERSSVAHERADRYRVVPRDSSSGMPSSRERSSVRSSWSAAERSASLAVASDSEGG